jgi:hypothetical protein
VGKSASGQYEPFVYKRSLAGNDVEISEDVFLISREHAEEYLKAGEAGVTPAGATTPGSPDVAATGAEGVGPAAGGTDAAPAGTTTGTLSGFRWSGVLPAQKWMNFYTKVLSRFATGDGMKLTVTVEITPSGGVPKSKVDETRVALRELGLAEGVKSAD